MKTALVDSNGIVQNVIVLDPKSDYIPPNGWVIQDVNNWVNIGDDVSMPEPVPPVVDETERKQKRDKLYSGDMAVVAAYEIEKKSNPNLTFSAYLDTLEGKINKQ